MPCSCAECLRAQAPVAKFATAEEGVMHELAALKARRGTWRNLASEQQALGAHVSAEHDAAHEAIKADGDSTRAEL